MQSLDSMVLTSNMFAFCDTRELYDKAGSYGIQGPTSAFVKEAYGIYSGVIGLPLYETRILLYRAVLI